MMPSDINTRQTAPDSSTDADCDETAAQTQNAPENEASQTGRASHSADTGTLRRRFLQMVGSASVLSVAGCSSVFGKKAKDQVNYQDHPKGDHQCANCKFFKAPKDGDKAGTCSRVKGDIDSDAWCTLYSK